MSTSSSSQNHGTTSESESALSLSVPKGASSNSKHKQGLSPTTYALTQHTPILLETPDSDKVCRPTAITTTTTTTQHIDMKDDDPGFELDLGIQNMRCLNGPTTASEPICKPVGLLKKNNEEEEFVCGMGKKQPPVLLDTPDKDTVCRPVK